MTTLELTVDGAIARIALSRPRARNALAPQTLTELVDVLASLKARDDIRVIVLEGQGASFSVGFDLRQMAAMMPGGRLPARADLTEAAELGQRAVDALCGQRAITIASVHGHAIGGGFLLAAACDLRVAAEDTVFSVPEVDIGLPLTWGGVPLLCAELGRSLARDLILTCRRFGPADLAGTGFIHRCVAPDAREAETQALAQRLAEKPPHPVRLTKEQLAAAPRPDPELFADAVLHPDFLSTAMRYVQRVRSRD